MCDDDKQMRISELKTLIEETINNSFNRSSIGGELSRIDQYIYELECKQDNRPVADSVEAKGVEFKIDNTKQDHSLIESNLKNELESTKSELDGVKNTLESIKQDRNSIKSELNDVKNTLESTMQDRKAIKSNLEDVKKQLENTTKDRNSIKSELNDVKNTLESTMKDRNNIKSELDGVKNTLENTMQDRKAIKSNLEDVKKQLDTTKEQYHSVKSRFEDTSTQLHKTKQDRNNINKQLKQYQDKFKQYYRLEDLYENFADDCQKDLQVSLTSEDNPFSIFAMSTAINVKKIARFHDNICKHYKKNQDNNLIEFYNIVCDFYKQYKDNTLSHTDYDVGASYDVLSANFMSIDGKTSGNIAEIFIPGLKCDKNSLGNPLVRLTN